MRNPINIYILLSFILLFLVAFLLSSCFVPDLIDTDKEIYHCGEASFYDLNEVEVRRCYGGVALNPNGASVEDTKGCKYDRDQLNYIYKEYFWKQDNCKLD